jgi:hypothetical protein
MMFAYMPTSMRAIEVLSKLCRISVHGDIPTGEEVTL